MPLWVDKQRPRTLAALDYGKEQAAQLAKLAASGELPHMLFYGPSGAGKKTRILALLRDIFGSGVERVKLEHRSFKTPSGRAVEVTTVRAAREAQRRYAQSAYGATRADVDACAGATASCSSSPTRHSRAPSRSPRPPQVASAFHIEINPGDAGIYDRFVVQDLIKEMAQYNPMAGPCALPRLLLARCARARAPPAALSRSRLPQPPSPRARAAPSPGRCCCCPRWTG